MGDNTLEQAATDLTLLTSRRWSSKPILHAQRNSYMTGNLEWLRSQGAIASYKNVSTFPRRGGEEEKAFNDSGPIAAEGIDADKLKRLAADAKTKIEAAEKAAHFLGLLVNTTQYSVDTQKVVLGDNSIRMHEFSFEQLSKLQELEAEGLVKLNELRFEDIQVGDYDVAAFRKKIDPTLKEAATCLNLFGTIGWYPWTYYPELRFDRPESIASGIMEGVEALKAEGLIDYKKDERGISVTVTDMDGLRTRSAAKLVELEEAQEAKEIIGHIVGKEADDSWFYNLDKETMQPVVDALRDEGAISYELSGLDDDRDPDLSFYLANFDLEKLRAKVDMPAFNANKELAGYLNTLAGTDRSTVRSNRPLWHYSPDGIHSGSFGTGNMFHSSVMSSLKALQSEGLINFKATPDHRIIIEVKNAEGLKTTAQKAAQTLDESEDVGQVLKGTLGNSSTFYRNEFGQSLRLQHVFGQAASALEGLSKSRALNYKLTDANVVITPVDTAKLIAYLEPRLAEQQAAFEYKKKSIELLGIAASGDPWSQAYHITPDAPFIKSGLMRHGDREYVALNALRHSGAISFADPQEWGPNGSFLPITVTNLAKLDELTHEAQAHYAELNEVAELMRQITGHQFYISYGQLATEYEYDEPVKDVLEKSFEALKRLGVIDYVVHWPSGRDYDDSYKFRLNAHNLDRLKMLAAVARKNPNGWVNITEDAPTAHGPN
ncbi:MAG: hypothetical protein IT558_01660 [Alphaproteobacteria bacterium]|nr:hypothetical protein [Alphaproteobacteria bacterium]